MKNKMILTIVFAVLAAPSFSWAASVLPIDVVNQRMDAYNNHDINKFMLLYANNISVYTYPDSKLASGKEHLESIFKPMFAQGKAGPQVKIVKQLENGNYVINEEIVTYANEDKKYISIYKVEKGLIAEVRFVRE